MRMSCPAAEHKEHDDDCDVMHMTSLERSSTVCDVDIVSPALAGMCRGRRVR